MMFRLKVAAVLAVAALGVVGISAVALANESGKFEANLNGYQELPTLSTAGNGTLEARLNNDGTELSYTLSYVGPFNASGTPSNVTQSHIHLGGPAFSGGVSAFLCTNLGNGPAAAPPPACPTQSGTVSGVITQASIVGPNGQGIAPGEFAELIRAVRAGAAYANIHTAAFPAGEIRGQISGNGNGDD